MGADLTVIIPAAGTGSRMGSGVPKPYLDLQGLPVLSRTLKGFDFPDLVAEILVAVAPDCLDLARKCVSLADVRIPVHLVEGGAERLYSIANALQNVHPSTRYIAVHDAVRPFFSESLLRTLYESACQHGAAIPGLPVTDTIKRVDAHGYVQETPVRASLRAVQTPQLFSSTLLKNAYRFAQENHLMGTDDAALVEQFGSPVHVIDGESDNIKLTYRADFNRAIQIIHEQNSL